MEICCPRKGVLFFACCNIKMERAQTAGEMNRRAAPAADRAAVAEADTRHSQVKYLLLQVPTYSTKYFT